jgi:hypothetical protein
VKKTVVCNTPNWQRTSTRFTSVRGRKAAMSLAWLLYRFGGQVEAEKILQNVLRAGQISSEISYFAARILMNKNRAASKQLFEELIKNGRQFLGFNEAKTIYKTIIW